MRAAIIKAFLPWLVFFSFANGSISGVKIGTICGLFFLFLFNRGALKKGFLLDWGTLIFFLFLPILGPGFNHPLITQYSLLWANIILTLICLLSFLTSRPVTLQYAQLVTDKIYWQNPILLKTNHWITFGWGIAFLLSSITIGVYYADIASRLWMIEILPTVFLISAIGFTITFPDTYHARTLAKASQIFEIPNISPLQYIHMHDKTDIAYRTIGEGPVIILIQDAYINMHAWDVDFLRRLASHFQLLIFDFPNTGHSSTSTMTYTAQSLAHCMKEIIGQLNLKPLAILGSGTGGFVAQTFILNYPKQTKTLILINTDRGGKKAIKNNTASLQDFGKLFLKENTERISDVASYLFPHDVVPRLENKISKVLMSDELTGKLSKSNLKLLQQLISNWYNNDQPQTKKISLPTLIIVGLKDMLIPYQNAKELKLSFKNSTLIEYDDAGHGLIYQYPFDLADQIKKFLNTLN